MLTHLNVPHATAEDRAKIENPDLWTTVWDPNYKRFFIFFNKEWRPLPRYRTCPTCAGTGRVG